MEVHYHPDLHHKPKPWKEYLLEFVMIFLAVTLGFFAESLREYRSDKAQEKEYVKSFIKNLAQDTSDLNYYIGANTDLVNGLDSLRRAFSDYLTYNDSSDLKSFTQFCISYIPTNYIFHSHDGTMEQLKNSGGFRLLQTGNTADSIAAYDVLNRSTEVENSYYGDEYQKTYDIWSHSFDLSYMMNPFYYDPDAKRLTDESIPSSIIIADYSDMKYFYNKVVQYEGTVSNYINDNLKTQLEYAARLIQYLEKVYGISLN